MDSDEGKKVCSNCSSVVLTSEDIKNTGLCVDCRSKVKCSKENPCQECKIIQKEKIAKIGEWEVKKKEKYERFEFIECDFCHNKNSKNKSRVRYSGDESYSYNFDTCSSCQKRIRTIKANDHGDKTIEKETPCACQNQKQSSNSDLSSLKSYLQTNQIKQISLTNEGELLIEYQNSQTKKTEANNQQLQQIKSYLKQNPSKVISIDNIAERERERERERESKFSQNRILSFIEV